MTNVHDPQRDLHVRRMRESLAQIPEWRKTPGASRTQGFQTWRERVKHSLGEVFGPQHEYCRRFGNLHFCVPRLAVYSGMPSWDEGDERACREDIYKAEHLLKDALEEVDTIPAPASSSTPRLRTLPETPPIVVQILNVLSQDTSVDVRQLVASIDALPLDSVTKRAAEEQVRLLEEEARGQHRWTVMAKPLDFLKGLGKGVYEKVALPLLLDIIKRQAGLGGP